MITRERRAPHTDQAAETAAATATGTAATRRGARQSRGRPPACARTLALAALASVLRDHRPLDDCFDGQATVPALDTRDRAFARLLVTTTLRRLGQIDHLLDDCLARPLAARHAPVRDMLRLGVAQLLFLDTAAHAAVDTTVRLAQQLGFPGQQGLINAVLRRLAREGAARLADDPDALTRNTPAWLWRAWCRAYGEPVARAVASAHLPPPPLDLTVRRPQDVSRLAAALAASVLPTGTLRLAETGPVTTLPGFAEGDWWVQDAAATLPARLLGDVAGRHVVDLCAAPGGKTAQLAAAGARVLAVDQSPLRMQRLLGNLHRLGLDAETAVADVLDFRPQAPPDAVLLDAPCSATGTIRRHPDVAWIKTAADVARLVPLQRRLLAAAVALLPAGRPLVYAVCSLQPEEGVEVVEATLAAVPGLRREPVRAFELPGLSEALTPAGDLRTLPCHLSAAGGLDGFYAARLVRD